VIAGEGVAPGPRLPAVRPVELSHPVRLGTAQVVRDEVETNAAVQAEVLCQVERDAAPLLTRLAAGGAEAKRAFEAMMPMKKIDIATIEAARRG
jgi:hypothetical protein